MHRAAGVRLERRPRSVRERHGLPGGQPPGRQPVHARPVQQLPHLSRSVQHSTPTVLQVVSAMWYQMSMPFATRLEQALFARRQTAAIGPVVTHLQHLPSGIVVPL